MMMDYMKGMVCNAVVCMMQFEINRFVTVKKKCCGNEKNSKNSNSKKSRRLEKKLLLFSKKILYGVVRNRYIFFKLLAGSLNKKTPVNTLKKKIKGFDLARHITNCTPHGENITVFTGKMQQEQEYSI